MGTGEDSIIASPTVDEVPSSVGHQNEGVVKSVRFGVDHQSQDEDPEPVVARSPGASTLHRRGRHGEDAVFGGRFPSITRGLQRISDRKVCTVAVLSYCNLINYMDRSAIGGMADFIRHDPNFNVTDDSEIGVLQTVFIVAFMLTAPAFGYMGDRRSRTWILGLGLSVWTTASLVSSFIANYYVFLFFRALIGVGEASYTAVAPSIISDLYTADQRSTALAVFYFAIPVGSGIGYMVGPGVAQAASDWRWGLRVTPFFGFLAILAILMVVDDPPRGEAEGSSRNVRPSTFAQDVVSSAKNKSFVCICAASSFICFSTGILMFWGPDFAYFGARAECGNRQGCDDITEANVALYFGVVLMLSGVVGLPVGSYLGQRLRHKVPNADTLVCGFTLMASVPFLYAAFVVARYSLGWCYLLTFVAGVGVNANWPIVSDMILYVVVPNRRSFSSATQVLVSHFFGDATSPWIIGAVSDAIKRNLQPQSEVPPPQPSFEVEFRAKQYAMFVCCFCQLAAAALFLLMSRFLLEDKEAAAAEALGNLDDQEALGGGQDTVDDEDRDRAGSSAEVVEDVEGSNTTPSQC